MTKRIFTVGIITSIAMAMIEMIYEGLFGVGFWSAPVFIAAVLLRNLQAVALPVPFGVVPVVVGLMGHMMNSIIFTFVFMVFIAKRFTSRATAITGGIVYALMIFFIMWFLVLPAIDPVMLNLNPYVFAFAHIVWGTVLGLMARIAVTSKSA
ncbi:MAG: hypothetical protein B7X04_01600 [Parcubacteria group bacterium 21-54-25]|nr:MAG: hypothetical protein B7X04_01600 [Parcubacteria group bacterium 21-54-25]HQU07619.1 hypothetical protein [Candidatus Paceibacterota bacterium]